ncbi:hypothetical protein J6590_085250 [Homalodisca vitripennis]|nr:hypothetical protein J6590_085250 [Homalodisca vitripennis]
MKRSGRDEMMEVINFTLIDIVRHEVNIRINLYYCPRTNEPLFHESAVYCTLTNQSQRLTYQGSVLPTLQATARLLSTLSATADHTYSTRDFMPHVLLSHNISFYLYLLHIYINIKVSALDWQSLPERLCSRTPASTVLYRTGHSVMNYSYAVVLCVSESVKDIFRLHACLQDSSLFPHFLITTWPSTTAEYAAEQRARQLVNLGSGPLSTHISCDVVIISVVVLRSVDCIVLLTNKLSDCHSTGELITV